MPARPWTPFLRGLAALLWSKEPAATGRQPSWQQAASRRRNALLITVLLLSASATALLPTDDGPITALHVVQVGLFALLFAWLAAGFFTAIAGFYVLVKGDKHALSLPDPRAPIDPKARTAIIMPICNEDIDTVFSGLRKTCESLAATGALGLFDVFVLSDTPDPELRDREMQAWRELRRTLGDDEGAGEGHIHYRWRQRRTKRKAGNVADFCRRWGNAYRYMVVLDADSVMSGETLVSMVRMMEAHPKTGILQTLPRTQGHATLHARTQQFASSVTGRLFALGLAYWQLGESHYWGHNAILRVEPFMAHCGLAKLPGTGGLSGEILSHDFVEAALMRRAGYQVWLVPSLEGSWEQQPPNLIEELARDRRWCQGNLQNARLIAEPGWQPVHRAMFFTGALSYAVAPLWLAFVAIGVVHASMAPAGAAVPWVGMWSPSAAAWGVWGLTLALLLLPRALGVAAVYMRGEQGLYGGTVKLIASACAELLLSAVQAPVRMLAHSVFVLGALSGLKLNWKSPPRDAASVPWGDALSRLGPVVLPAVAIAAIGAWADAGTLALVVPLALGIPLAVWGSREQGADGRLPALLLTPDEHRAQVRAGVMRPAPLPRRAAAPALPAPKPSAEPIVVPRPVIVTARAVPQRRKPVPVRRPLLAWAPRVATAFSPVVLTAALAVPQPLAVAPAPKHVISEMDTRFISEGVDFTPKRYVSRVARSANVEARGLGTTLLRTGS